MTLTEALASVSECYIVSTTPADASAVILASGGVTDDADAPPLLCLTREQAVREWLRALHALAEPGDTLRWAEKPGMYRYQVTISNAEAMTHRIVADRFAVICGVQVVAL